MRYIMVAGLATAVLALGAGCANDTTGTPGAAATSAAAASPSAPAGDPACDSIKALQVQYFDKVIIALRKAAQAAHDGDLTTGEASLADARKLTTEWAGKLEPVAGQVKDPELKAAVGQFLDQLKQFGSGKTSMDQIQTAAPALTTVLLKACP